MGRFFIFGAGQKTRQILADEKLKSYLEIYQDEIVGIIDNDSSKSGTFINGFPIYGAEVLTSGLEWDFIAISSIYHKEIIKQLITNLKIDCGKVVNIDDYIREKFIALQYNQNRTKNIKNNAFYVQRFDPKSLVVYTAITSGYDELKEPLFVDDDLKYVCFTDNREIRSDVWEIRYIDLPKDMEARHFIRKFKILPHLFFPEYNTSIWVDGSFNILGDLRILMQTYQEHSDILFFPHYVRNCIYDEGAACMLLKKDAKRKLVEQMNEYFNLNYPEHNGLLCGNFMVRNHNEKRVIGVMEDWWDQVCRFSKRDQISLPFALWKNNYSYDLTDLYVDNNTWIKNNRHKIEG